MLARFTITSLLVGCFLLTGCKTMSGGMKSIKESLASMQGSHSIFRNKSKGGTQNSRTSFAKSSGLPSNHYTNSPEFNSLATKTPSSNPLKRTWENATSAFSKAITFRPKAVDSPKDEISLATKSEPLGAEYFVNTAQLLETRGDFQAAASQYQRALKQTPDDLHALVGLARLQDKEKEFGKAEQTYRQASTMHPKSAFLANEVGLFHLRHQRVSDSITAFDRAVRLAPDNSRYRNNMATALVDAGQPQEALKQLNFVHLPASAHYNLGYLLHHRGQDAEARRQFQLALESDPTLAPARSMLAKLTPTPTTIEAEASQIAAEAYGPGAADSTTVPQRTRTFYSQASVPIRRDGQASAQQQVASHASSTQATTQASTAQLLMPVPISPSSQQQGRISVATNPDEPVQLTPNQSTSSDGPLPPIVKLR